LDSEWLKQIVNPRHVPAMRPDANALMQGYADAGYHIFYLTARGELLRLLDGTSARQATQSWLQEHDFPFEEDEDLFLASGLAAMDDAAVTYKQGVVEDLMAQGWYIAYAYGNALTDIEAYKGAGIPDDRIFLVGKLAGQQGVNPIPNSQAYTEHLESFLPTVPSPQCP
jgi:phosphatidate phosphatase PAH1